MKKIKEYIYLLIHINYIIGFFYAFFNFLTKPKVEILGRRLWAYECWIILSFYILFIFLILYADKLISIDNEDKRRSLRFYKMNLLYFLILLLIPWGMFLLLGPNRLMRLLGLDSIYWRILGTFSLIGFLIYFFPYRYPKHRFSRYVMIFGIFDNIVPIIVILVLFSLGKISLLVLAQVPLLIHFLFFFIDQTINNKEG